MESSAVHVFRWLEFWFYISSFFWKHANFKIMLVIYKTSINMFLDFSNKMSYLTLSVSGIIFTEIDTWI